MRFDATATCIGSFPHRSTTVVCDFLMETLPDCPTWPQLPQRDARENMYAQYAAVLPGALIDPDGKVILDTGDTQILRNLHAIEVCLPPAIRPVSENEELAAPGLARGLDQPFGIGLSHLDPFENASISLSAPQVRLIGRRDAATELEPLGIAQTKGQNSHDHSFHRL